MSRAPSAECPVWRKQAVLSRAPSAEGLRLPKTYRPSCGLVGLEQRVVAAEVVWWGEGGHEAKHRVQNAGEGEVGFGGDALAVRAVC